MAFEDGRVRHLYEPRADEVVVVALRSRGYVYHRGDDVVRVSLEADTPTVLEASAARQLLGDGVEIVDEPQGELPTRTRLLPRERGWWSEEGVVAS